MRGVFIYTYDNSLIGANLYNQEIPPQLFNEIFNKISQTKNPLELESTYDFLKILDNRCDIQIKCNKYVCPKPKECKDEKICRECPKPRDCYTTTTTSQWETSSTTPNTYLPPLNSTTISTERSTSTSTTESTTRSKTTTEPSTTISKSTIQITKPVTPPNTYLPPQSTSAVLTSTEKSTTQHLTTSETTSISLDEPTSSLPKFLATTQSTSTAKTFKSSSIFTKSRVPPTYLPIPKNTTLKEKWTGTWIPNTFVMTTRKSTTHSGTIGTWRTRTASDTFKDVRSTIGYQRVTPENYKNFDFLKVPKEEINSTPQPERTSVTKKPDALLKRGTKSEDYSEFDDFVGKVEKNSKVKIDYDENNF